MYRFIPFYISKSIPIFEITNSESANWNCLKEELKREGKKKKRFLFYHFSNNFPILISNLKNFIPRFELKASFLFLNPQIFTSRKEKKRRKLNSMKKARGWRRRRRLAGMQLRKIDPTLIRRGREECTTPLDQLLVPLIVHHRARRDFFDWKQGQVVRENSL